MKKISLLATCLLVSACAQVIASNERQITITAPPAAAPQAFKMADEHCAKFDKVAVPTGTVYGTATTFECEKP